MAFLDNNGLTRLWSKVKNLSDKNLANKYILFIGDSYSGDWTVNSNNGWCKSCIKFITSQFGKENDTTFQNEHYKIISLGGTGFSAGNPNVYVLLQNFISNNSSFMNKVTDVVFALGYNDAYKRSANNASTVDSEIKTNITNCNNIINQSVSSRYINKYLFAVGWGSNPSVRWSANYIYKHVYNYASELGWLYSDLRYVLYESNLYYKDWVHPNKLGSDRIAQRIVNALIGNNSVIPCENVAYYSGSGALLGYLNIVNNDLAQFYVMTQNVLYKNTNGYTLVADSASPNHTLDLCEIKDLVPFGDQTPNYLTQLMFHIVGGEVGDAHLTLGCWISKRYSEDVEGHSKYKSYISIANTLGYNITFTHIAICPGVINIVPRQ